MQHSKDDTLPAINESRQKTSLSPFTWTNLGLPSLNRMLNSTEIKRSLRRNDDKLASITEVTQTSKKLIPPLASKQSISQKPKSKDRKADGAIITDKNTQIRRINRYSSKNDGPKQANKTIDVVGDQPRTSKASSLMLSEYETSKKIKMLDGKSNMQNYIKNNLNSIGWKQSKNIQNKEASLLWANTDRFADHLEIKKGQYYNHIEGSASLTYKDKLHQEMQFSGREYYPKSFLIPKEYDAFMQQNNNIAVKSMLRRTSLQILEYFKTENLEEKLWNETHVHIGEILQSSIFKVSHQIIGMLVKMCLYLEHVRTQLCYDSYFQKFEGYFKVNILPSNILFQTLIKQAVHYLDNSIDLFLKINYKSIDFRLLALILHYDTLFKLNQPTYASPFQLWIVKPIASSRGAGISMVRSSSEFCQTEVYSVSEFKNRKKYENKIMQKYISNVYLLKDIACFSSRKFDIRQWVLLVSANDHFSIYKYHTAYCRFASQKYDCSKLANEIHLTNYSQFKAEKQESVMMIDQLFSLTHQDIKRKYSQQSTDIIQSVIQYCRHLKHQDGCFELFGFDFLLDCDGRLYLLEINLNPSCSAERHAQLQEESQNMVKTMIQLVTNKKSTDKWVELASSDFINKNKEHELASISNVEAKPVQNCSVEDEENRFAMFRQHKRLLFRMCTLIKRCFTRQLFIKLRTCRTTEGTRNKKSSLKDEQQFYLD